MLKKLFGFDSTKSTIRNEIIAGVTTFLTMSYILAVNPAMFKVLDGMPGGAVFTAFIRRRGGLAADNGAGADIRGKRARMSALSQ